jgi:hypothetical protein
LGRKNKKESKLGKKAVKGWKYSTWMFSLFFLGFVSILVVSYRIVFYPKKPTGNEEVPLEGALIVDQFYSLNPVFTKRTIELFNQVNMRVDVVKDENVTVELYRKLPTLGYRIIILRVHSGISLQQEGLPTVLFTSEEYTTSRYVTEQLSDQIVCGFMGITLESDEIQSLREVLAVSPKFVEKSMEGEFGGSIIVLSSCFGLYTIELAEAFLDRGADVLVSWNDLVNLQHTDDAMLVFLNALVIEKLSIEDAVRTAMSEVGPDPQYKSVLSYHPLQRKNTTLWSSVSSIQ